MVVLVKVTCLLVPFSKGYIEFVSKFLRFLEHVLSFESL